ncbi:MAG: hypothetical protein AB7O65_09680 [Candidatus Korobacteraceae bacterium]
MQETRDGVQRNSCPIEDPLDNYFNYFTEIEEHFQRRRGTLLLLSTLDWALIETWKDAGIPLEAVLRGIDAAFEMWERRPSKTRKVNGLAYCAQEVLAASEEMQEAEVGATRVDQPSPGFEPAVVAAYLRRNADFLSAGNTPPSAIATVFEAESALRDMAASVEAGEQKLRLEDLERRLTVMEEKLFAALLTATADDSIVAIRAEADRELSPYRRKMSGAQIEQLHKQYLQKKLLEKYGVPRLSLFYM